METTAAFRGLICTACGATHATDVIGRCPDCDGICQPHYDPAGTDEPPLPFPSDQLFTAGEGDTPLVATDQLAAELGIDRAFVKDEGRNPTGSFVDRGMAVAVTAAADAGREPLALAAAGNGAQSAAAYAGRAGLRSYGFIPSRTAFSNKALVNVHGGEMRVVGGRYDDAEAALAEQLAASHAPLGPFRTPYRHDAAKTVLYECLAEYAAAVGADGRYASPDTLVVPVGTGELLVGVRIGLEELQSAGRLADLPTVVAAQPDGCAPIVDAYRQGREPEPWATPDTIVGELEIPNPAGGDLAVDALEWLDGRAVTVTDDDALESAVTVAQTEVLEIGGAGGVAAAAAWTLADEGELGGDTVLVNPDAGVKTPDILRSHLMGKGV